MTDRRRVRVSPKSVSGLSEHRRTELATQIENGLISEGTTYGGSQLVKKASNSNSLTKSNGAAFEGPVYNRGDWREPPGSTISSGNLRYGAGMVGSKSGSGIGTVAHSESFLNKPIKKQASIGLSSGTGSLTSSGGSSGGMGVDRLAPEVYSPLFTMANLNLPRDRVTVNAWSRNFYDLHPIVRNAITLHATYPISKLSLKCHDRKVLQFFEDMIENMNLMEGLGMLALEFWKLGEAFPFLQLDEERGQWSSMIIHNPDYIHVKKTVLAGEPLISMKADSVLQRLVMSNNPSDIQIRKQIPENIQHYVRKGLPIPLDNFHVSHLKMLAAPYDVRGTSIIVSVFKDLMLYDKLRECYSEDTEFLTENGFKKYDEISEADKLATYSKETNELEYQNYTDRVKRPHDGEMYHFFGKKIDMLVTPGHRMWLSKDSKKGYKGFDFIEAQDVKMGCFYRSMAKCQFRGENTSTVNVLGNEINTKDYMKLLGYLISEGCVHHNEENYQYSVSMNQDIRSQHTKDMCDIFTKISNSLDVHLGEYVSHNNSGFSKNNTMVNWRITRKAISSYFSQEIGSGAENRKIPQWVKKLEPHYLKVLLNSLVSGDGSIFKGGERKDSIGYRYSTISKQLSDDICEIVFKCGYSPRVTEGWNGKKTCYYYAIAWSENGCGEFPVIYGNAKNVGSAGASIEKISYSGNVVCFTVPNELLIVRRNGLISIQGNCKFAQADSMVNPITVVKVGGNSDGDYRATQEDLEFFKQMLEEAQYDKDFKLITHAGVDIQKIGSNGAIIDTAGDFEMIMKNIYTGLMVPPSVVDSDASSYNSASIGLEVLRQRYFNFRNMLSSWLQAKVFAPISDIHNFTEYKDGARRLIVPEVEWNKMNLYDLQDYIGNITGLLAQKQVSLQTVYKSLGLNYEEEIEKQRQEVIQQAISLKEQEAISMMSLSELRALDPSKPISEPVSSKELPKGQAPGGAGGAGGAFEMPVPGGLGGGLGGPEMAGLGGGMPELAPPPMSDMGGVGGAGGASPGSGSPAGAPSAPLGPGV